MSNSIASRLVLPSVTLCAVSSSNVAATVRALEASLEQVKFAHALLFTHETGNTFEIDPNSDIQVIQIDPIESSEAYSQFVLEKLAQHIKTDHCLIVQWDGHVVDASQWRDEFLDYDYIGASWPQFDDGRNVGNGGFSLRSKRLLQACLDQEFKPHHPEDIAICRTNRSRLEALDCRFAPAELADQFSAERAGDPNRSFGYHGIFLMPSVLGGDNFWKVYKTLDDRSTIKRDFKSILAGVAKARGGFLRALRLLIDRIGDSAKSS